MLKVFWCFSYSYDLTHSLQINMALPKGLKDMVEDVKEEQENVNKRLLNNLMFHI